MGKEKNVKWFARDTVIDLHGNVMGGRGVRDRSFHFQFFAGTWILDIG